MKLSKFFLLFLVFSAGTHFVWGQSFNPYTGGEAETKSPVRKILNKFPIGLYSGYGRTFYNGKLGFKGTGHSIPLNFTIHFAYQRFRIGGGLGAEYHILSDIKNVSDSIPVLLPENKSIFFRYFGMAGFRVFDYWGYSYVIDLQAGKLNYGRGFDKDKSTYFNAGITIEKNLSEYFRLVLRPSYEFRTYKSRYENNNSRMSQPAVYLHAGISYSFPDIRRCPIDGCEVKMKHRHGAREFRGSPVYKKQNPRIGELEKSPFRIKLKKTHTEKKKKQT